ncbi:MAG TPA: SUF system Fe-S cluster assembly protein [Caldithrix abyssi]|uniref:SUF system Fe-S cluster assembly protein n=1 Tax=Caldithrix abyssi TaxID=187145 RepID=A0A7V5UDV8_CALAY|nr:SUF system Fe-S cluster assembly protein [Caldithrix abyssi]
MSNENAQQATEEKKVVTRDDVIAVLKMIFDPEIPVDIYNLGLVYDIQIDDENNVKIRMTLTAPSCPAAQSLPMQVDWQVRGIPGVKDVDVEIVWDPPWSMDMMSEEAKLTLGYL